MDFVHIRMTCDDADWSDPWTPHGDFGCTIHMKGNATMTSFQLEPV